MNPSWNDGTISYCDAEHLFWTYDQATETLHLLDARIVLNCCGDHSIEVAEQPDQSLLVTEIDDGQAGRCLCSCVFDYLVSVHNLSADPVDIRIVRDISEEADLVTVWEGTLRLEEGNGSAVVDASSADPWCSELDTDT